MSADPIGEAQARVAADLEGARHIRLDAVVVSPPDALRKEALERVVAAAASAGRRDLLEEARAAARRTVMDSFSSGGFSGTWAATETSISVTRVEDRVALAAALEEAVVASVGEDLVDPDTTAVLRATWATIEDAAGIPPPGSLDQLTSRITAGREGQRPFGTVAAVAILGAIGVIMLATGSVIGVGLLVAALVVAAAGVARWRTD